MITHYEWLRVTKWPLWSLTRRDRAAHKMCVGYIYNREQRGGSFISLRIWYTYCVSGVALYRSDGSENTHCRHLLAFWQLCRFRIAPVFFNYTNCVVAKRKSSSGGTQGGSVMRMSFFWLAALVFACAGECWEQFPGVLFIYLTGRQSINLCGICVKTPGGSEKVFRRRRKKKCILSLMSKSLTWLGKLNCCGLDTISSGAISGSRKQGNHKSSARPWQPESLSWD